MRLVAGDHETPVAGNVRGVHDGDRSGADHGRQGNTGQHNPRAAPRQVRDGRLVQLTLALEPMRHHLYSKPNTNAYSGLFWFWH